MKSNNKIEVLINGSILLIFSNLIIKAANFFLLPLYTKFLTPDQLGISDIITNMTAFIFPILVCAFDSAFSAFYYDNKNELYRLKVFNTTLFFLIGTSAIALLLVNFSGLLSQLLFTNKKFTIAISVALVSVAANLWFLPFSLLLRIENKMFRFSVITIVSSFTMITLNVYFVVILQWGYFALIVSTAIIQFVQCILYFLLTKVKINLRFWDSKLFWKMLKYAAPLIPMVMVNWVLALSDRYILLYFYGENLVGIYGIAARFVNVLNIITSSIYTAYTAFAFSSYHEETSRQVYGKILNGVFLFISLPCWVISIWGKDIITLMVTKEYYNAYMILSPLLFGQLCYTVNTIVGYGIAFAKKSHYYLISAGAGTIINLVLNVILIPKYGLQAAAVTTFLGYFLMMILSYILAQKVYPCKFDFKQVCVLIILLTGISSIIKSNNLVFRSLIGISGIILNCYLFRLTLKESISIIVYKLKRARGK